MHDEVDALDDGGWWEGQVTQVGKQRYKVQPFISTSCLTVKRADVRSGVVWDGKGWSLRQTAGGACVVSVAASVADLLRVALLSAAPDGAILRYQSTMLSCLQSSAGSILEGSNSSQSLSPTAPSHPLPAPTHNTRCFPPDLRQPR